MNLKTQKKWNQAAAAGEVVSIPSGGEEGREVVM